MARLFTNAEMAKMIVAERQLLIDAQEQGTREAWNHVLNYRFFWTLRHDGADYSTRNMTDREVQQSIIEDLLFTAYETNMGSDGTYPILQVVSHLSHPSSSADEQFERIVRALDVVIKEGYVIRNKNDTLTLNPLCIKEAQDFSGVYLPDFSHAEESILDNIISVGGIELLEDALDDITGDCNQNKIKKGLDP